MWRLLFLPSNTEYWRILKEHIVLKAVHLLSSTYNRQTSGKHRRLALCGWFLFLVGLQCIIQNVVIDILKQVYLHVHVGVIRFPAGPKYDILQLLILKFGNTNLCRKPGICFSEWMSDCCLINFSAIPWREQITFQWVDKDVRFVLV